TQFADGHIRVIRAERRDECQNVEAEQRIINRRAIRGGARAEKKSHRPKKQREHPRRLRRRNRVRREERKQKQAADGRALKPHAQTTLWPCGVCPVCGREGFSLSGDHHELTRVAAEYSTRPINRRPIGQPRRARSTRSYPRETRAVSCLTLACARG